MSSIPQSSSNQTLKQEPSSKHAIKSESSSKPHSHYSTNDKYNRRRERSYERYCPSDSRGSSRQHRGVKNELATEGYSTSKHYVKPESRGESSRHLKSEHKPHHTERRIRRTEDNTRDCRQRSQERYKRPFNKSFKPGNPHYMPSFLSNVPSYPPSRRGGEEELKVLEGGKLRKKIYLPRKNGVNYIGLLIGPRGMYQKKLEEETGCKILIRGNLPLLRRGHREGHFKSEDNDHEHVLIITENKESMQKAEDHVRSVITATEGQRDEIRQEQLCAALKISQSVYEELDESLLTPYGPPSPFAHIIPVPNECVGLIIGRGGETIRQLQVESGAKIQVAKSEVLNTNMRNVFIEGPPEKYEKALKLIEDVVEEHKKMHNKFSKRDKENYHSSSSQRNISRHKDQRYSTRSDSKVNIYSKSSQNNQEKRMKDESKI